MDKTKTILSILGGVAALVFGYCTFVERPQKKLAVELEYGPFRTPPQPTIVSQVDRVLRQNEKVTAQLRAEVAAAKAKRKPDPEYVERLSEELTEHGGFLMGLHAVTEQMGRFPPTTISGFMRLSLENRGNEPLSAVRIELGGKPIVAAVSLGKYYKIYQETEEIPIPLLPVGKVAYVSVWESLEPSYWGAARVRVFQDNGQADVHIKHTAELFSAQFVTTMLINLVLVALGLQWLGRKSQRVPARSDADAPPEPSKASSPNA